jgi:uncharacterized iron-regulated membrane protein
MALFLCIAALTGIVLSFDKRIDAWLNPQLFRPATPGTIDPAVAVAALERRHPELIATYFPVLAEPGRNIAVAVSPHGSAQLGFDELYLDGGDGLLAGVRRSGPGFDRAHLVRGVYELHCNLLFGTPGRWLMGIVALAWLISNLVGLYLTVPARTPRWKAWKRMWSFRWSSPLPRLLLDLHRASALWLLMPLTVLAFTSIAMSFYDEAFIPLTERLSPSRLSPPDGPTPPAPRPIRIDLRDVLRDATALARRRGLGWQPALYQRALDQGLVGIRFTASGRESYRDLGPVTYWFNGQSGRFVGENSPYDDSAGRKLQRSLYPLHTGQMIGPMGVALDVVLGLATLEMAGTGIYLWLKRRPMRRRAVRT